MATSKQSPKCFVFGCFKIFLYRIFIGIKKLLDLIDMARFTEPQHRVNKLLTKMEDEGGLDNGSSAHH